MVEKRKQVAVQSWVLAMDYIVARQFRIYSTRPISRYQNPFIALQNQFFPCKKVSLAAAAASEQQ